MLSAFDGGAALPTCDARREGVRARCSVQDDRTLSLASVAVKSVASFG